MSFLNKLKQVAGIQIEEKNTDTAQKLCKIEKDDSIDVIFAKKLIQNNGIFLYCDNRNELIQTIKALTHKLNTNLIYCTESILQKFLKDANIEHDNINYSECDAILSSCEYLLAHHGKIMLSSKQLGPHSIKNLPKEHIIIAYTSQIVKNLNEAMYGINTRYMDNLPSTITTITSSKKDNDTNTERNIKNLSVLLIEDFKKPKI